MSVFRRSALRSFVPPERSAPGSLAFGRSDPSKLTFRRIAPLRFPPVRSAWERSAPVRSARAPPSLPLKKRSCASRISASDFPLCLMLFGFLSPIGPPAIENVWRIVYSMWRSGSTPPAQLPGGIGETACGAACAPNGLTPPLVPYLPPPQMFSTHLNHKTRPPHLPPHPSPPP